MKQGSKEWFYKRRCRLTASRFKDVLSRNGTKRHGEYMRDRAEYLSGVPYLPKPTAPWYYHGTEWENEARGKYAWLKMSMGNDCKISDTGLFVHPKYKFISGSPDGKIVEKNGKKRTGGLEIKSHKSLKGHLQCIDKMPVEHKPQVQGCLWITGWDFWDFVSFYKDIKTMKTHLKVHEILPDIKYHEKLEKACLAFWWEVKTELRLAT